LGRISADKGIHLAIQMAEYHNKKFTGHLITSESESDSVDFICNKFQWKKLYLHKNWQSKSLDSKEEPSIEGTSSTSGRKV
jgi:hypothetical protein